MQIKEAARLWGVKEETARDYCVKGIVPGATKDANRKWQIPDNSPKPLAQSKLANILYCANHDGVVQLSPFVHNEQEAVCIINYFEAVNLISVDNGNVYLTQNGQKLVNKQAEKNKKPTIATVMKFVTEMTVLASAVVQLIANL